MENTSNGMPQFSTAEPAPTVAASTCAACRRPIIGNYFQIARSTTCTGCAATIQGRIPTDSHAAFLRALGFGLAGAIAGLIVYVVFAVTTGLVIGWVSLAVGFMVGRTMNFGSRGVGGRRYQIAAAVLTYLAVSLSAVPISIHQMREHRAAAHATETHAPVNIPKALGVLALVGVASPFLDLQDPIHGLIGLVILAVGMRFAWRYTANRAPTISGPHTPSPASVI